MSSNIKLVEFQDGLKRKESLLVCL